MHITHQQKFHSGLGIHTKTVLYKTYLKRYGQRPATFSLSDVVLEVDAVFGRRMLLKYQDVRAI